MSAIISSGISALLAAWVVYLFALRKLAAERRTSFLKRQLSELYSPLAATQQLIRGKSKLRAKIRAGIKSNMSEGADRLAVVQGDMQYNNQQWRTEILPLYRNMLDVFTKKYWLADPDTRAFYQDFLEFVEIWHRNSPLPPEVGESLDHDGRSCSRSMNISRKS